MSDLSPRKRTLGKVAIAHFVGLWAVGVAGSIGTTAGIDLSGSLGLWLGGIVSLPWIAVLGVIIWFRANWIDQHRLSFAAVGPFVVCASWAVISGGALVGGVALSCVISSLVFLMLPIISAAVPLKLRQKLKWYFFDIPQTEAG